MHRWRRVTLVVVAAAILLVTYWPAQAAFELLFFTAQSSETAVLLSWATAREINVQGYKILCKRQDEPESKYHVIGTRMATGGPNQGAAYTFDVTADVYYGEQYCFRIEEETTDGLPGEKYDICGYGPGITPTPPGTVTAVAADGLATPILVTPPFGVSPAPTLITPTQIGVSPLTEPGQPISPLDVPGATPTWTPIGQDAFVTLTAMAAAASLDSGGTPTFTPTPTTVFSPLDTPTFVPTFTPSPTTPATPVAQEEPATLMATGGLAATPTPLYIVVTATPTPEVMAAAPSLTPLPTVTPTPDMGLLSVLTPSAQNMMIMLLCLIFLSATGLGTLGLLTSILYFRSQAQRRSGSDDFTPRRRY